jgi:hypothetical protein
VIIPVGIWTGQKWAQIDSPCTKYQVYNIRAETAEITLERLPADPNRPRWTTDLSSFIKRHQLVSNA